MYHQLNNVLEFISAAIQGYCLQYFYGSFLEERFSKKYRTKMSVTGLYSIFQLGIANAMPADYGTMRTIERLIFTLCILMVIAFCFYKETNAVTVFLVVTFLAVKEISFFLSYMVLMMGGCLLDIWIMAFDENLDKAAEITLVISQILMYAAYMFLLYFALKRIVGYFSEKNCTIQKTELAFLVTPGLVGLLNCETGWFQSACGNHEDRRNGNKYESGDFQTD